MHIDRLELVNTGLSEPVFTDIRGIFKVVIYKKIENPELLFIREKSIPYGNAHMGMSIEHQILSYCIVPRSREEIASKFGFEAPTYFIKTYVNSLIEKGKIKLTLPEKPKSKFQRYYTDIN